MCVLGGGLSMNKCSAFEGGGGAALTEARRGFPPQELGHVARGAGKESV